MGRGSPAKVVFNFIVYIVVFYCLCNFCPIFIIHPLPPDKMRDVLLQETKHHFPL